MQIIEAPFTDFSLHCTLVPVQYGEFKYGLLGTHGVPYSGTHEGGYCRVYGEPLGKRSKEIQDQTIKGTHFEHGAKCMTESTENARKSTGNARGMH